MGRIDDEQRHVLQTSDLHLATIEALARAIDAKDQTTQMHIRRVQVYATGLAKKLGLPDPEIQGIKTAALLHDIGKLAVPEHILSKPGPLTQEEFQKIRIHPQVGAEIIAAVPFPYPVAPLIMSHHERWDGKGYPQGLAGADIPLGARILTIVDYYDAVTTERPYHKALSYESAIGLLKHEAGRALDPKLVPMFIEMLPSLIAELGPGEQESAPAEPAPALPGSTAVGLVPAPSGNAFENIALAHREIYALYEIAQSMGTSLGVSDTMALISSKLSKIVSWSGCALFLYQQDSDSLKCRFAAGVDAPQAAERDDEDGAWAVGLGGAQPPHLDQRQPARQLRRRGDSGRDLAQLGDRLPAAVQRHVHRLPGAVPRRAEPLHRGSPPAARADRGTGGRRHPQLDRVRADAGRFADRPADRPAQPPLDVRAPVARAGAGRAPQERGRRSS